MLKALVVIGALVIAEGALAQGMPPGPGAAGAPGLGKVNPASTGGDDIPGTSGGWGRKYDANGRMREKDYRAELARNIAGAERLVGQPLTDRDRGKIRGAIRSDLIAWRKQYDPRRADYRTLHDHWLVDEGSLTPDGWAKQRVNWLRAQQQWIVANVGEADTLEAVRAR